VHAVGGKDSREKWFCISYTPRELGSSAELVAARLSADVGLAAAYLRVFDSTIASDAPETVLVNIAKVLAAFQETLRTGRILFDGILMLQPERQ